MPLFSKIYLSENFTCFVYVHDHSPIIIIHKIVFSITQPSFERKNNLQMFSIRGLRIICRILMIVLAMTECNFPRLQFAALLVKLQATVTGRADVIPKDISHMVQHANHTGGNGFGVAGYGALAGGVLAEFECVSKSG